MQSKAVAAISSIGNLKAANPRDYIYGVLGLAGLDIVPDYQKPLREVYRDFVEAYIRVSIDTDQFPILDFLGTDATGLHKNDFNLPSWAPRLCQC